VVTVKGPKFRSARINPNRRLGFNPDRDIPFGKRGVTFRKRSVEFRKRGVKFRTGGLTNIDLDKNEDPIKLNNLGVQYYNKGKYKIALNYFDKTLAVAPQFKDAKQNRLYCIQMLRQRKDERRTAYSRKNMSMDYKKAQQISDQNAVEVHPLDYNATRFGAHHQYGRVQSKKNYSSSDYNKPYWDTYRR
jgi:tetratricopeptide (TPR) repeat protein